MTDYASNRLIQDAYEGMNKEDGVHGRVLGFGEMDRPSDLVVRKIWSLADGTLDKFEDAERSGNIEDAVKRVFVERYSSDGDNFLRMPIPQRVFKSCRERLGAEDMYIADAGISVRVGSSSDGPDEIREYPRRVPRALERLCGGDWFWGVGGILKEAGYVKEQLQRQPKSVEKIDFEEGGRLYEYIYMGEGLNIEADYEDFGYFVWIPKGTMF